MEKKMGFWSIVLLTINSIIGTGIFLSPGKVAAISGTKAPLIYIAAAIFAAMLAISFASAAKYVTESGAAYAYSRVAFGQVVGQYVGVTRVIAASIAWGAMGTFVVRCTLNIFGYDSKNVTLVTIGFLVLMAVLLLVNIMGSKIFTLINDLSTIGKVIALLITIGAGAVILMMSGVSHINEVNNLRGANGELLVKPLTSTGFVTALIAAFYAFTGFESIASGSQDMEKPEINLPRAIPFGIVIIALIYFGIILVGMNINPDALIKSKRVVVLAAIFKNEILRTIVIGGALVSMFGINVAASFHTPRVLEAMAREGQVPKFFAKRNKKDLPLNSFLFTAIVAILIPLSFNYNLGGVLIISSISRFIQFLVVPIAVICFYKGKTKHPTLDAPKNYLTDVIIPIIAFILSVVLLVKFNWVGQFSIVKNGISSPNVKAITSMLLGYVGLPIVMWLYVKFYNKNANNDKLN